MDRVCLLALVCALVGAVSPVQAQTKSSDQVHWTLAQADSQAVYAQVPGLYAAQGGPSIATLDWSIRPFDHVFNYYDVALETVVIGAVPESAETGAYWDNWSAELTGGNWRPDAFFAAPEEAFALAGFNQFVLAAHEAGHAMMYQYDPDHLARHNDDINCRELYADRFALALVRQLAAEDARFATLLARYRALIEDIDASIADPFRYTLDGAKPLLADCAMIAVAQPTPETLEPYASAYFQRHIALLDGPDQSLPALFAEIFGAQ